MHQTQSAGRERCPQNVLSSSWARHVARCGGSPTCRSRPWCHLDHLLQRLPVGRQGRVKTAGAQLAAPGTHPAAGPPPVRHDGGPLCVQGRLTLICMSSRKLSVIGVYTHVCCVRRGGRLLGTAGGYLKPFPTCSVHQGSCSERLLQALCSTCYPNCHVFLLHKD